MFFIPGGSMAKRAVAERRLVKSRVRFAGWGTNIKNKQEGKS